MLRLIQLPEVERFGIEVSAVLREYGVGVWTNDLGASYCIADGRTLIPWEAAYRLAQEYGYYIQSESYGLRAYRGRWLQWCWGRSDEGYWEPTPFPSFRPSVSGPEAERLWWWRLVQEPDPKLLPTKAPPHNVGEGVSVVEPPTLWDMVRR